MYTSDRLFIAPSASLNAIVEGVSRIQIEWDLVSEMHGVLQRSWFPRQRTLQKLGEQLTSAVGIIELAERDTVFSRAPADAFYQGTARMAGRTSGIGEEEVAIALKSRMGPGPFLEFAVPSLHPDEFTAGLAVGSGLLKAAGIWRPVPESDPTDIRAAKL